MDIEPSRAVMIVTEQDDPVLIAGLIELALTATAENPEDTRRGGELLGPVLEYVLPSVASLSITLKLIQTLVRGWRPGSIIELGDDDKIAIRKDSTLPRGMVVVQRDNETIEVLDTTQEGAFEKLSDLLRKPGDG